MSATSDIHEALATVESTHGVRVLYACESGSRAWGFPSATSDYDVRFIFAHPPDRYCGVREPQQQISLTDGLYDFEGWDLRKALLLLRKMNPSLIEWLHSPILYRFSGETINDLRRVLADYYSPRSAVLHYRHLAYGNWCKYLAPVRGDGTSRDQVEVKKYLYVCRALLASEWALYQNTLVPVPMADLLTENLAPWSIMEAIRELVARRHAGDELAIGPRVPDLDRWIVMMLEKRDCRDETMPIPWEELDRIMLDGIYPPPCGPLGSWDESLCLSGD